MINKESTLGKIDTYFRRDDTTLSRIIHKISPLEGEAYLRSNARRVLDLSISIPAAIIVTPVIGALAFARKLEDPKGPIFYNSPRVDHTEKRITIKKIRCMYQGSDRGIENHFISVGLNPEDDPRNTPLGSFMRKYQLEELPQLYGVIAGKWSIVGIRALADYDFDLLDQTKCEGQRQSYRAIYRRGKLGLTGARQVLRGHKKQNDVVKMDGFYADHASLNFDLYLLWRTMVHLLRLDK